MSDTTALRDTCKAQEWQRDGRGLWAMRACRLESDHGNRHEFSPWRYNVDVREAIAALAQPAATSDCGDVYITPFSRKHECKRERGHDGEHGDGHTAWLKISDVAEKLK